ncbi:MAG: SBBP repeat-containing protein [Phycisphaerales bacterium]
MRNNIVRRLTTGCLAAAAVCLVAITGAPAAAQTQLWTRQAGTPVNDQGYGVAVDAAGNAHVSGYTNGSLGGTNLGGYDYFVAKYDASGALLWSRQGGTASDENGYGVAVDGAGNVYVGGYSGGSLAAPNAGSNDIILAKYDSSGGLLWTRQSGTAGTDQGYGVAADNAGNAYVTGYSTGSLGAPNAGGFDAVLLKYDASGTLLWTRQAGTDGTDLGLGVGVDIGGNVYFGGYTGGALGGPSAGGLDAYVIKYNASGTLVWSRQTGSDSTDIGLNLAVTAAGHAHIAGYTFGDMGGPHAGGGDPFIARYDESGVLLWTRQPGTAAADQAYGVAVDGAGNAYLAGFTEGDFAGPNAGSYDAFLAKYNASGTSLWTRQTGTSAEDRGIGVGVQPSGAAYITGPTSGSFGGPNAGSADVYLAKFGVDCYADCNASGSLTVADFGCFQGKYVLGDLYADCNASGTLTVADFGCFQGKYVLGCP